MIRPMLPANDRSVAGSLHDLAGTSPDMAQNSWTSTLARRAARPALALLALPLALLGCADAPATGSARTGVAACATDGLVYVGTDGGKIEALRLDACAGKLASIGVVAEVQKARWGVMNPGKPILYIANDVTGKNGSVVAFRADRATGALTRLNEADAGGIGTTHLWLDAPSMTLLAANFFSGSASSLAIADDGSVGALVSTAKETGSGPHKRQTKAHAHGIAVDLAGRWVLVADLGADRIFIDGFDRASRVLSVEDATRPRAFAVAPGSGPHHAVFSRDGRFVYLLDELTADVQVLRWDAAAAQLTQVQSLAISSAGFTGAKSGAEIVASADGRFVYVLDRGEAALVVYGVDARTGQLSLVQRLATGGDKPWGFGIHPSGQWLLVANGAKVSLLRVDPATGLLADTGQSVPSPTPLSLTFMP
jgi:6-phosphogluconolactonase